MERDGKDILCALRGLAGAAWQALLDLFFPPPAGCAFCGGQAEGGGVCPACRDLLAAYRERVGCVVCGAFLEDGAPAGEPGACAACRKKPPPFALARSLGPYEGLLKAAVLRLKFGGECWLARPLGGLLAELARAFPAAAAQPVLVPVPLSPGRLRERGYNQAGLLAREMSRALGWPLVEALVKIKEAPPQERLTAKERLAAPEGSFAPAAAFTSGSEVVLVDDVITTGATAAECARALLRAGASAVFVAAVAGARRA